jgi:hypothetical protein
MPFLALASERVLWVQAAEGRMRYVLALAAVLGMVMSGRVAAQPAAEAYFFRSNDAGQTWCGFSNQEQFKEDSYQREPGDTFRVNYSSGKIVEVTRQTQAHDGVQMEREPWIVIDRYRFSENGMTLTRASILVTSNLMPIQEVTIMAGKAGPFRLVRVTTMDGKEVPAETLANVSLPAIPVITDMSDTPFMRLLAQMRKDRTTVRLCTTP